MLAEDLVVQLDATSTRVAVIVTAGVRGQPENVANRVSGTDFRCGVTIARHFVVTDIRAECSRFAPDGLLARSDSAAASWQS